MNGFFSGFYHKSICVIAVHILTFMDSIKLWLGIELMRLLYWIRQIMFYLIIKSLKKISISLFSGSLGSYIDEERSKMRYFSWLANYMNEKVSNANCADGF